MVHISLPHRKYHGTKQQPPVTPQQNNVQLTATHERRPSPSRALTTTKTPTQSDRRPLILRINVIRARNLAAKNKSGTNDPFLVVNLGSSRQSTPTIQKTLNPEWNICLDMPLLGVPLVECICWDRDRFGKDYLGEFDIAVEDIFADGKMTQEAKWYKLKSTRKGGKKSSIVSGDVLLQFSLADPAGPPDTTPDEIYKKFKAIITQDDIDDDSLSQVPTNLEDQDDAFPELEAEEDDDETSNETDPTTKSHTAEKTKKKKRLARLRRQSIAVRAYEFAAKDSSVSGILFVEISKITDLPPERNFTRTSFDMDPFVVASLGRKVLRTRVIRHNLNPVFNEKMVFQVMKHETSYLLTFSVIDRDSLSGNDFIASTNFPLQRMIQAAPDPDLETGLYPLQDPPEPSYTTPTQKENKAKFRLPLSRTSSATSLHKLGRVGLNVNDSQTSLGGGVQLDGPTLAPPTPPIGGATSNPTATPANGNGLRHVTSRTESEVGLTSEDPDMIAYTIPLELKNKERWEAKHAPELFIKAKYLPYAALRQQFWRAMLRQYDADDSGRVSRIELVTMLDTLGSTLRESTINSYFERFAADNVDYEGGDLSFDQTVICLEEQLQKQGSQKTSVGDRVRAFGHAALVQNGDPEDVAPGAESRGDAAANGDPNRSAVPVIQVESTGSPGEEGRLLNDNDLAEDGGGEEHVVEIRECPICHQPKLNKRTDAEIVTHIATCASSDWRQVNNLVMGGFVTASQAQRKWYSKIITKISYGGYRLGANSANILVQDRTTGQINEERMSVYVRLGIRLLYKMLGSREMEKKRIKKMLRSLSLKQGKKYDDPASVAQIKGFISFHRLDMSEVALPIEHFRNFNAFFYRALKPGARPCSAPDDSRIIVSPADSRSVVFNKMDDAARIWVKGRDYSVEKLLGDAYPLEAKRYKNGALGIFRLAPQDYHRFHIPVDGVLGQPKAIDGEYYTVNPMAIRSALDVYGDNIRVVVPIDSVSHGRVMYICIGAMMVGSTVITRKAGEKVKRTEELGYFKFGGSTILMLFESGSMVFDDDLVENSSGALETLVRVGMSVGHHPSVGPYKPDMKKDEGDVTMEERQEAKRRIEGSLAPDGDFLAS